MLVNFTASGTAGFTGDYSVTGAQSFNTSNGTGTVKILAGQTSATVTIDPTADSTVESDETVIFTVNSGTTGYEVGSPSTVTGTITNDDTDIAVTVSPASVSEDGAGNWSIPSRAPA